MPCYIKGPPNINAIVQRNEEGILLVVDSLGNTIYSPDFADDDQVIQWGIDYIEREYTRQALENLFDIRGEISK